ncbi:PilZ domain-containing protein [Thermodesulforhabdus norvegica]|uniref:PilZ domain-containing protein n=1 Tax=Thermodesulforhabdus norvegica TaxID=39841 RepID=A0A1I4SPJ6_9BACT|nr:PilZ domain-containing protein [Thermodesulforhabdus norvegica]SFM66301.1 PilZ domain-containing protein [Thermodesulforhabdus norvegica]
MKQNRRFTRTTIPGVKVVMKTTEGKAIEALLRNISLCGVSVVTDDLLPVGAKVEVEIIREPSGSRKSPKHPIQGHIVRHTSNGMAVEFAKMDVDQFSYLKELIASRLGKSPVLQEITDFLQKKDTARTE